jgi:hypothetical protein
MAESIFMKLGMHIMAPMPKSTAYFINPSNHSEFLRRGADKSLAIPIFLFAAQPQEFFLVGLMKLEQRSHKCVELREEYVNIFFQPVNCFLYKAKDLSAPLVYVYPNVTEATNTHLTTE